MKTSMLAMSKFKINIAERLERLPPYLFAEIDRIKQQKLLEGRDVIDLGIGDPDKPTPDFIIDSLYQAAKNPANHRYALDTGLRDLRISIAKWYNARFGVVLDPDSEILPLIGSKEGIAHIPLAFVNPGDTVLVPDPCYPPYRSGTIFAGGKPVYMPLREENSFLPDLSSIGSSVANKAVMMFLNYPNNPTTAVANVDFFNEVVKFALKYNIIICHDAAYSEIYYTGYKPVSFLKAKGAKDVGVEFHSLSKSFNMTGWRIGFVCGNKEMITALRRVKSNIDSGVFNAIQRAGITALSSPPDLIDKMRRIYQERRDVLVDGLNSVGWKMTKPRATFYVWSRLPKGEDSAAFSRLLLEKADIIVTPGVGFGQAGEGYIRMALTVSVLKLQDTVERIGRILQELK